MKISKGTVVKSNAGRDKNYFQIIMDFNDEYAFVCDGKRRPLEKMKRKNIIHLNITNNIIDINLLKTNKSIRKVLKEFK